MTDREDELARTATAVPSTSGHAPSAILPGSTLGRYRLERELGAGAMGVVHLAFDPDLERRVAVKVLRADAGSDAARQRLLREARAMARLSHPHVVVVHEVGSASGRDYVAMELVDGETLADWLRASPRTAPEILEAFVAAGRGLAAAHAAGIVHRDFKPHNVLRSRGGRIVVTDFGLARDADLAAATGDDPVLDPLAATQDVGALRTAAEPPAPTRDTLPLGGLTQTGSLLGTPAYMAPEQWKGGAITPATDQFAFCVALWESLAGARPFQGSTLDELRAAVLAGPGTLDASALPRRLRAPLVRGLATDPARRFAGMDALLDALHDAERTRGRPLASAAVILAIAAAIALVVSIRGRGRMPIVDPCRAPALPAGPQAWAPSELQRFQSAGHGVPGELLDRDARSWVGARARVCGMPPALREPHLACLDAVAMRWSAIETAIATVVPGPLTDLHGILIDPAVCELMQPPRLTVAMTPAFLAAAEAQVIAGMDIPAGTVSERAAALERRVARTHGEACAESWARLAGVPDEGGAERDRVLDQIEAGLPGCDDERVHADVAIALARDAIESLRPTARARFGVAKAAVARVRQPDLEAWVAQAESALAMLGGDVTRAIELGERAAAGYRARGRIEAAIRTGLGTQRLRTLRGASGDRESIDTHLSGWRAEAVARLGPDVKIVRQLDAVAAERLFSRGDLAGAHAPLAKLHREQPLKRPVAIRGRVLDARGAPIAGATVTVAPFLEGTSVTAGELFSYTESDTRVVTTSASGEFAIAEAPAGGVAIAEHGMDRSPPMIITPELTLRLASTVRVSGRVSLGGHAAEEVTLSVHSSEAMTMFYELVAPVAADGSFTISGVQRGQLELATRTVTTGAMATTQVKIDTRRGDVTGVRLVIPSTQHTVNVIVRSQTSEPTPNAQVYILPGTLPSQTMDRLPHGLAAATVELCRPVDERSPPTVRALARTGDLFASSASAIEGASTACALGLPSNLADADLDHNFRTNMAKLQLICKPVPPTGEPVLLEVPPWPRLE